MSDLDTLIALNRDYIHSVQRGDVQPPGVAIPHWLQQQAIHDGKHRRGCTNPQG